MGLESSVVEEACRELGISVPQKHLSQLSTDEVGRLKKQLEGKRGKETRVDGTVVRRRKRGEEEVGGMAASSTQVAGGAGAIATSATTVRRKRAPTEEMAPPIAEPHPMEPPRVAEPVRHAPAAPAQLEARPATPGARARVETKKHVEPASLEAEPVVEAPPERAEAASVTPPVVEVPPPTPPEPPPARPEPVVEVREDRIPTVPTSDRAVIVGQTRPARRIETGGRSRQPEPARRVDAPTRPPEPPRAAEPEPPPAPEPAPAPVAPVARAPEVAAAAVAVATTAPRPVDDRQSHVQVVRRVDDAIMQNILREAERRAERQNRDMRGPPRGPAGPGFGPRGPGGPGGPGGPPMAGGPRPPRASDPVPAPAPGATPGRPLPGKDKPAGQEGRGRVAWEKSKDKSFDDRVMRMRAKRKPGGRRDEIMELPQQKAPQRTIKLEDTITVGELASQLSVKASEIIKTLMQLGEMVTVNNVLDLDTVQLLAQDYNFKVENVAFDIENYIPKTDEDGGRVVVRDPVVTVMGHVDHGKTSLLDAIRKTRVAAGEAGGITQHIGAYKVPVVVNGEKRHVVFLDTPGHAAFTQMRARGAQVTDVVILVVAADDGVMPQTIEAINHAKAAEVPLVVAVNKIDKPDARPETVRQQLTQYGVVSEEWGGEAQFVNVSAKSQVGIDKLLESVCLQADVLELKAVENRPAKGVVIEAELSKGRGPVATVLVQEGTLEKGDIVVAGKSMGRVRAMVDDRGQQLIKVGPSTPVEVLGLDSVPPPSERFFVVKDERDAKAIVSHIEEKERKARLVEQKKVSLDDLFDRMKAGEVKTLNLVIKSDVQGSLEALRTAFSKLKHPELEVRIIHDAVGAISEHDVYLASASQAIIIGFNVRPEKNAKVLAEQEKIDIKLYSVIYDAVDDVRAAMEGMLKPNIEEKFVGKCAVREVFSIPKIGTIAGSAVLQGKLVRGAKARLIRDSRVIFESKIDSLRRFKESVNEVERGFECGVHLENFNDIKQGDEIECYELIEIAQKLEIAT
ncbi:MAG: translation initiation factor IF-2 [Deltaproteobacteria bacterium]|nr:translation initiation factor IF-2 [Deltaproteobacteria bacterium]